MSYLFSLIIFIASFFLLGKLSDLTELAELYLESGLALVMRVRILLFS
jgi:hypothetical protein